MARQSRIQTVAGLHPSKTLVDTPNSPSTMAIHKRTAILNIQNYAKGYQDKHTGHHSPWQNPITSGINIQMKNCDKSQQHKRRPKPTTSITTHIAKMPKHATIKTNTYPEDPDFQARFHPPSWEILEHLVCSSLRRTPKPKKLIIKN